MQKIATYLSISILRNPKSFFCLDDNTLFYTYTPEDGVNAVVRVMHYLPSNV